MARGGGNAIASAAVTLTANADGLVTGFNQAEARLKQFGQNATKTLARGGNGSAGGPSALVAGLGAVGITLGSVVHLLANVGRGVQDAFETTAVNRFNRELERTTRLADTLARIRDKSNEADFSKAMDSPAHVDPRVGLEAARDRAMAAQADLEAGMKKAEADARAYTESDQFQIDKKNKRASFLGIEFHPSQARAMEQAEARAVALAKEARAAYEQQTRAVEKLDDALAGLAEQERASAESALAAMDQENAQAARDFQGSIDQLTESLQLQVATLGMSAEMAEIYRLKLHGATDEQLKLATQIAQQLDALRRPQFAGAVEMGSREAYSIDAAARYGGKESPAEARKRTNELLEQLHRDTIETQKEIEKLQLAWEVL